MFHQPVILLNDLSTINELHSRRMRRFLLPRILRSLWQLKVANTHHPPISTPNLIGQPSAWIGQPPQRLHRLTILIVHSWHHSRLGQVVWDCLLVILLRTAIFGQLPLRYQWFGSGQPRQTLWHCATTILVCRPVDIPVRSCTKLKLDQAHMDDLVVLFHFVLAQRRERLRGVGRPEGWDTTICSYTALAAHSNVADMNGEW